MSTRGTLVAEIVKAALDIVDSTEITNEEILTAAETAVKALKERGLKAELQHADPTDGELPLSDEIIEIGGVQFDLFSDFDLLNSIRGSLHDRVLVTQKYERMLCAA
jgi:hypothetical protein